MKSLLVLRPEPGACETVARAQAIGLDVSHCPLFTIQQVKWDVPEPDHYFGLLLTSANAVRFGGTGLAALRFMPVFAVGEATATAAREAGFESVVAGDGDVARLLARIATLGPQRLLHLAGEDFRSVDVSGIEIDRRTVYSAHALPLPDPLPSLLAQSPVVMVHSPRAAARFAALCDEAQVDRSTIALAAISDQAARAAGDGWEALAIAAKPRDEALIEIAEALCNAG
ncbi:MAG: uroporphyrinogen-III synthase [Sphingomonadaceae bacterium]